MKSTLTILALAIAQMSFAQIKLPQVSGKAEVEQTIGYTDIDITYARPNLNNRKAFGGDLVPFGKVWRTGANDNAIFENSTDVTINGKTLPKGKYALFCIPNANEWEIIFYNKTDNWGAPEKLDENLIALKTKATVSTTKDKYETFTIGFKEAYIDNATLFLAWDQTMASLKINTNTFQMADEILKKELNDNASARDYFSAAYYYFSNKLDLNKALEWINVAIKKDPSAAVYNKYKAKIEDAIKAKK